MSTSVPKITPGVTIPSLRHDEWFGPTPDGSGPGAGTGAPIGPYIYKPLTVEQMKHVIDSADPQEVYDLLTGIASNSDTDTTDNTSKKVSGSVLEPSTIDYLNAELAKHYGMSRESAYQEALSNTAYQRAVADMQAAGLNPAAIFGNGKGATASGVGYVSGGSGSSFGSAKENDKLFSSGMYNGIATLVGLISAIATKKPGSYYLYSNAAKGLMSGLDAIF